MKKKLGVPIGDDLPSAGWNRIDFIFEILLLSPLWSISALLATRAILHTTKEAGLEPLQGIKLVT